MAHTPQDLQAGFWIGECHIEPRQNRIVRGATEARLERRVMDVLVCLAEHAGDVVSRDTLSQKVWGNVVVTDQALTNCISELRQHLGDDRGAHRVIETIPKRGYRLAVPVELKRGDPAPAFPAPSNTIAHATTPASRKSWLLPASLSLLVALAIGAWWWSSRQATPALTSVAVLRFENAAKDADLDYLALALPDEVATLLTQSHGVAVRPFGYVDGDDPLARARERGVDHVVSGRFYREDDQQLSLAVEAQHVRQERVVWRTRITVPAGDLLAMRGSISEHVRQGLLPALGARAVPSAGSPPTHDTAYQLYLRSLALPRQPTIALRAIAMLEQVVKLEPDFAPAWQALGMRYYDYGTYSDGGEPARQQSLAAHRKAYQLDPNMIAAAQNIITHRTESGDLAGAYEEARELLEKFGSTAETQYAIAYVYRYGGLLEEAQRHCELALNHDPQNPQLRACGNPFMYAGKHTRAREFFKLDEGSYFSNWATVLSALRANDTELALKVTRQAADDVTRGLMQPCLEGARGAALDANVAEFIQDWERSGDPEAHYAIMPMLAYCGRMPEALRFVERAVDGGFCSYPALEQEALLEALRDDPEFQRIRGKAIACHEKFRAAVQDAV